MCVVLKDFFACCRQWWNLQAVASLLLLLWLVAVSSSVLTWRRLHFRELSVYSIKDSHDTAWGWFVSLVGESYGQNTKLDDVVYHQECDASWDYYASTNQPLLQIMYFRSFNEKNGMILVILPPREYLAAHIACVVAFCVLRCPCGRFCFRSVVLHAVFMLWQSKPDSFVYAAEVLASCMTLKAYVLLVPGGQCNTIIWIRVRNSSSTPFISFHEWLKCWRLRIRGNHISCVVYSGD